MTKDKALKEAEKSIKDLMHALAEDRMSGDDYRPEELEALATLDAIKEALAQPAQPVQEPTMWITPIGEGFRMRFTPPTSDVPLGWDAFYTTPDQRPWVDLRDSQIETIYYETVKVHRGAPMPQGQVIFGRAVQDKLRELNA